MSDTIYIIDKVNDTSYYTEVRVLLGITSDDLTDAELKSDVILGMAERLVCGSLVPNWTDVLNGGNQLKADALRSCVVMQVAINILDMPAIQNLIVDQIRLIDIIITAKKQTAKEIKSWLGGLQRQQLAIVGITHTGGWPGRTLVGKTKSVNVYDYTVDTNGNIQKS